MTNELCSYTIDIYWRPELGAGWNLWFWLGRIFVWPSNPGQQYCLCNYRYCRTDMVNLDVYRQTCITQRPLIKSSVSCLAPQMGRFFCALCKEKIRPDGRILKFKSNAKHRIYVYHILSTEYFTMTALFGVDQFPLNTWQVYSTNTKIQKQCFCYAIRQS